MTTKRDENDNKYSKGLDPLSHMHGRQPSGRMDHGRYSIFEWLWSIGYGSRIKKITSRNQF